MDILEDRLENERVPSDEVAEEYYSNLPDEEYDDIPEEVKREAAVEATKQVNMREPENKVKAA
jgi:hypothetical protein